MKLPPICIELPPAAKPYSTKSKPPRAADTTAIRPRTDQARAPRDRVQMNERMAAARARTTSARLSNGCQTGKKGSGGFAVRAARIPLHLRSAQLVWAGFQGMAPCGVRDWQGAFGAWVC